MHSITYLPRIAWGLSVAAFCAILLAHPADAGSYDGDIDAVLAPAEALFKAMEGRDYAKVWTYLSRQSRNDIVRKIASGAGGVDPADIDRDFAGGGRLSRAYWDAFLDRFDPRSVLEQSRWETVTFHGDRAEIRITHRKASNPLVLQMFREDGAWKVGFAETFL